MWVVCRKFRQTTFSFKFVYTLSTHLYPHTHEGCDFSKLQCSRQRPEFQSTHPRRVWRTGGVHTASCTAFQSTHPRRVWHSFTFCLEVAIGFQSTHPRRVWLNGNWRTIADSRVSIHTPTKGVTLNKRIHHNVDWFQSTHPRRVWLDNKGTNETKGEFQSTHPRRVWPKTGRKGSMDILFQSTHPRRVWHQYANLLQKHNWVSIHTPTKGVTATHFLYK